MVLVKKERRFLPTDFKVRTWQELEGFFKDLEQRSLISKEAFENWLKDRSELESVVSEDLAWRYIKMTCDTASSESQNAYKDFVENIQPHLSVYSDLLNKKMLESAEKWKIDEPGYEIMLRGIKESVKIFRESNIPLYTEIQLKQSEYQAITGAMTVTIHDEEMTMPKASTLLFETDRAKRENAWRTIAERRFQDKDALNQNFDELLELRNQVALNADFKNFRDYMFSAMTRFDYSPQDCFDFHKSVASAVVPIVNKLEEKRKTALAYSEYRPWDTKVDAEGKAPAKPFADAGELLKKTISCFNQISPDFAAYIVTMDEMNHFDLDSRKGKAPGGYNYPLEETGVPFIFMNNTNTIRDLVTMVHEGGHAIHSFQVRELELNAYRNPPMEVAELASMGMELISMEHWDAYFPDENELKRAKRKHLADIIKALPWIATVDKFQHWIYENPSQSHDERKENWLRIYNEFSDTVTDWSGLEKFKNYSWQRQLHIYEVPFYYIEYGMAQLGAIALWRNYKKNPKETVRNYLKALSLGYTKSIKEIYEEAGIQFNFSEAYISELMAFVEAELEVL